MKYLELDVLNANVRFKLNKYYIQYYGVYSWV